MKTDLCEKCGVGIEEAPGGCGCKNMSGECEICNEHTLDCQCKTGLHWISVKDKSLPDDKGRITGYNFPAIHKIYGYGVVMKQFIGGWAFTNDYKYFYDTKLVTHYMELP